jgi:hypothetical protein
MSAFFMPPDDLQLDELTNATLMKLEQFRDRTSTGGKHTANSIEKHRFLRCLLSDLVEIKCSTKEI